MIVDEWVTGTIEKMRSVSEPELLTSKTASVVQQPNNKKVPILTTQKVNQVAWIPKRACNQHNTTAALETKKQQTKKKKTGGPKRRHSISSTSASTVDEWVASVDEWVASIQKEVSRNISSPSSPSSSTSGTADDDDQSSTPLRKQQSRNAQAVAVGRSMFDRTMTERLYSYYQPIPTKTLRDTRSCDPMKTKIAERPYESIPTKMSDQDVDMASTSSSCSSMGTILQVPLSNPERTTVTRPKQKMKKLTKGSDTPSYTATTSLATTAFDDLSISSRTGTANVTLYELLFVGSSPSLLSSSSSSPSVSSLYSSLSSTACASSGRCAVKSIKKKKKRRDENEEENMLSRSCPSLTTMSQTTLNLNDPRHDVNTNPVKLHSKYLNERRRRSPSTITTSTSMSDVSAISNFDVTLIDELINESTVSMLEVSKLKGHM